MAGTAFGVMVPGLIPASRRKREEASLGLHVRVDKIARLHLGPLDAHASPEIVPIRFDGPALSRVLIPESRIRRKEALAVRR
jgi:hypothetical protein